MCVLTFDIPDRSQKYNSAFDPLNSKKRDEQNSGKVVITNVCRDCEHGQHEENMVHAHDRYEGHRSHYICRMDFAVGEY